MAPWAVGDVDKHRKGLTQKQKKDWVKIANSSLASCLKSGKDNSKCDGIAIATANSNFETKEQKESSIINAREKSLIIEDVNIQEHYNRINECYPEDDIGYGYPFYPTIYIFGKDIEVNIGMHNFDFRHDMMNINGLTIPIYDSILPFFDETVSKITINNYLEFLYPNDVIFLFEEAFIVLQKDGIVEFRVPSTEGKNAFSNLRYKSYFNELTFAHLTDGDFPNFSIEKLEVTKEDNDFYFIDGIFKKTRSIF